MSLFTEFNVQCLRIVPDGAEWTDVRTAFRWHDTMSWHHVATRPWFIVYPPTGGGLLFIVTMPGCRCRPL